MKTINYIMSAMFLAILFLPQGVKGEQDTCVECHLEIGDEFAQPIKDIKGDVHDSHGLSCVDCHGGDATSMEADIAMAPETGFTGVPTGEERIEMCARCHSDPQFMKQFNPSMRVDQAELYRTSVHGKLLVSGDKKTASCTDCHGNHGIFAPDDSRSTVYPTNLPATCGKCHASPEYMKDYNIPTNQLDNYKQSVHGDQLLNKGDLSSPACNDCHGNHGAAPPGVKSVAYVCSQCHPVQEKLFRNSPHAKVTKNNRAPSCSDCHRKHKILHPTDEMIGTTPSAICTSCHSEGDSGGWAVAGLMRKHLETLKKDIEVAKELLHRAEDHGMPSVELRYDISQVESDLVQSRTLIHAFSLTTLENSLKEGSATIRAVQDTARNFFEELSYRKIGLWITWLFIAIFVLALIIKIRDLNEEG